MRLIDADEVLKSQFIHVCKGRKNPATVFVSEIENAPTIDALEVMRMPKRGATSIQSGEWPVTVNRDKVAGAMVVGADWEAQTITLKWSSPEKESQP